MGGQAAVRTSSKKQHSTSELRHVLTFLLITPAPNLDLSCLSPGDTYPGDKGPHKRNLRGLRGLSSELPGPVVLEG